MKETELIRLKIISTAMNVPVIAQFIADAMKPFDFSEKKRLFLCFVVESILELRRWRRTRIAPNVIKLAY